ncbi:MAG: TolC family protein [Gemmatimonadota bacterium]|nr:TolC family protein [Gemmatimonadota bacterium]
MGTVLAVLTLGVATPAHGQDSVAVTLEAARTAAREHAPMVGVARARARAAREGVTAAGGFRLPSVGVEAGAMRSNDPVAAFGTRLRQGRITAADFDPTLLNDPAALTDWSGAVGARWAPVDFSRDAALAAARSAAEAARLGAEWTVRASEFQAEVRYVEAVGMARELEAARAALEAAAANERVIGRRAEEGFLTDADVLQARASVEAARAGEIDARRRLADARARLGVVLGWPLDRTPIPVDTLIPFTVHADEGSIEERLDLRASHAGVELARARVREAGGSRLPTVEGFARFETHSPEVFSGMKSDWTVGFTVKVPVFTGFQVESHRRAAQAQHTAMELEHERTLREARVELEEARRALDAATQGARAAEAAAAAAEEALRLMQRRFEEGLTTTAELLGAESRASALRVNAVRADLNRGLAAARLNFLTDFDHDDLSGGMDS